MAHTKKTLPASRPRNVVVRALMARFGFASATKRQRGPHQAQYDDLCAARRAW